MDTIRMDHAEMWLGGVEWIGLAQNKGRWRALLTAATNLPVQYNSGKLSSGFTIGCLSSSAQLHRVG
jgi:hypothetical protein